MTRGTRTLTSIGIDVGTTTTHAVLSELTVRSPPGGVEPPEIVDGRIVHRGWVHETPLLDPETIDVDGVTELLEAELEAATITRDEIDTGAVIVTGETARRSNAEPLAHRLATEAGQFVAATAGPELEAVLAGRGSSAASRATETHTTIVNVDVGGGTTNVAVFDGDRVRETRCLDVGGRLVRFDDGWIVTQASPPAARIAAESGTEAEPVDTSGREIELEPGTVLERPARRALADAMADRIVDLLEGPPYQPLTEALAIGSLPDEPLGDVDGVVFSGGVGRLVGSVAAEGSDDSLSEGVDPLRYDDFGPELAAALSRHDTVREWPLLEATEDIRATVVGAGTESTTLSGRTISADRAVLPLQNVPVVGVASLDGLETQALEERFGDAVVEARSLFDLAEVPAVALSISDVGSLEYARIQAVGCALSLALNVLPDGLPVVIVTRQNCAKALGQILERQCERPLVAIDELHLESGVYLDVGEPLSGRESVPVVAKTLAFGR